MLTIASLHGAAGDDEAARRMLPDALSESRHIPGNHRASAWGFVMLGGVHRNLGQPDRAAPAIADAPGGCSRRLAAARSPLSVVKRLRNRGP
jgi:hypothetical protein